MTPTVTPVYGDCYTVVVNTAPSGTCSLRYTPRGGSQTTDTLGNGTYYYCVQADTIPSNTPADCTQVDEITITLASSDSCVNNIDCAPLTSPTPTPTPTRTPSRTPSVTPSRTQTMPLVSITPSATPSLTPSTTCPNENCGCYEYTHTFGTCSTQYDSCLSGTTTINIPNEDAGLLFTICVGSGGIISDSCGFTSTGCGCLCTGCTPGQTC